MNVPIPKNRLVAFTLTGALLTMVVAGGLAFPGFGLAAPGDTASASSDAPTGTNGSGQQLAADAPTPNENFTPAVQTQSGYEEEEYEESGEEYEEGEEEHEESGEEYEEGEEEYEESGENGDEADHEESGENGEAENRSR